MFPTILVPLFHVYCYSVQHYHHLHNQYQRYQHHHQHHHFIPAGVLTLTVCQLRDVCRTLFVYLLLIKTRTEIPWNRDSIPDTYKNCLFSTASKLVLESDRGPIPGIKWYIREADQSPPSDRRWAAYQFLTLSCRPHKMTTGNSLGTPQSLYVQD